MDNFSPIQPVRMLTILEIIINRDSKIDLDNPYYHEYDEWVEKHKKADLSVEDIGGLECGKCHY